MSTPKAKAHNYLTEAKPLAALITSLSKRGKQYDKDMHIAAMSAAYMTYQHGDTSYAVRLLNECAKSVRLKAVKVWLLDFSCAEYKLVDGKPEKNLTINKDKRAKGFEAMVLNNEELKPFYEYTQETLPASPLVAMDEVKKLIDRLTKAQQKGNLDEESKTVLAALTKVAPSVIEADNTPKTAKELTAADL